MGRIYEERGRPDNMRWFWSLYGVVGKPSRMHMNGDAATLDEAKAQFETAWRQWQAWAKRQETPEPPLSVGGDRRLQAATHAEGG